MQVTKIETTLAAAAIRKASSRLAMILPTDAVMEVAKRELKMRQMREELRREEWEQAELIAHSLKSLPIV